MKRLLVSAAAIVAALGLIAPGTATGVDAGTKLGPYGPVQFQDFGSCGDVWSDVNLETTYIVGKKSGDGTYDVQFDLTGPFTSIAGSSPGACNTGTDNGSTISKGIKGKMTQNFHIVVSGGKFNPKGKCDDTCATDYVFDGVNVFVSKFFKGNPTWTFSATQMTHQLVTSTDKKLCKKKWELDYDPTTGVITNPKGDIATKCK